MFFKFKNYKVKMANLYSHNPILPTSIQYSIIKTMIMPHLQLVNFHLFILWKSNQNTHTFPFKMSTKLILKQIISIRVVTGFCLSNHNI